MTLWEVAQELRAKGEHLTENAERQFAYFEAVSMIQKWAREKAKEWDGIADELHEIGDNAGEMRVALWAQAHQRRECVDDLGVPAGEEKCTTTR